MSKVICMASAKGGSGKTTLTATFAELLAGIGKSVLIVDTDASTNGLTLLYLKEVTVQRERALSQNRKAIGTYERDESSVQKEIVILPNNVHLIPATYSFRNTEDVDIELYEINLEEIIVLYSNEYDFIFLDAQAGSDQFARASMRRGVADEIVIVSEYDPLSAAGVERLKALFRDELTYDRTWVLLNKMLAEYVQSFSDFLEVARYLSPIPWDANIVRAYSRRKVAIDLENGNEITLAIIQTLKVLLGDLIRKDLDIWLKNKSEIIKAPLEQQYNDTMLLLENLSKTKKRYTFVVSNRRILERMSFTLLLFIALYQLLYRLLDIKYEFGSITFINTLAPSFLFIGMFYFYMRYQVLNKNDEKQDGYFSIEENRLLKKLEYLDNLRSANPESLFKTHVEDRSK